MPKSMFRYLEKYVGIYRVLPELDLATNDFPRDEKGNIAKEYDDLYIPCAKGIIKNSYDYPYLVWYTDKIKTGRKIKELFEEKKIDIHEYYETDGDVLIWFDESDIKKVAKIVKPKTSGKKISPFSKRNIQTEKSSRYIIPEKDIDKYSEIIKDLDKAEKLHFSRSVIKDFYNSLLYNNKKSDKIEEERLNSGLSYKEYIHYLKKWNSFIDYAKDRYEELYK